MRPTSSGFKLSRPSVFRRVIGVWPYVVRLLFLTLLPAVDQVVAQEPVEPAGRTAAEARQPQIIRRTTVQGTPRTIIEFPASADTYIASNVRTVNLGSDRELFLGYDLSGADLGAERILLRFDAVSDIPSNARINSAAIHLYLDYADPATDPPMQTRLRRLASPWGEDGVTWQTEPAWGGVRATLTVNNASGWYDWDVTSLVTGWVRGNTPNYGVEIQGGEHVRQRERVFHSREGSATLYPRLIVDYSLDPIDTEAPETTVEDLADFSPSRFSVSWEATDPGDSGIDYYDVDYRVDDEDWERWLSEIEETTHQFTGGENGRFYEFRARAVDRDGNVEEFGGAEASTTVDTWGPITEVEPLPRFATSQSFTVEWLGNDHDGAGIDFYDVRYRFDDGSWVPWQQGTIANQALFTAVEGDGVYQFEARGIDEVGNLEPFVGRAEAATIIDLAAPFVVPELYLPMIHNAP